MTDAAKLLTRSASDRVIAGVCGGLADYLDVDPLFIRLAWILMVVAGGFGILLYIAWVVIVPVGEPVAAAPTERRGRSTFGAIVGGLLVMLGVLLLLDEFELFRFHHFFDWSWKFAGPALLIAGGSYLIFRRREERAGAEAVEAGVHEPAAHAKRFQKSRTDRKVFGVCGGMATYFDVDPTLVRLAVAGVTLAAPPFGVIGYLALAIFAPSEVPVVPPVQPTPSQP
ncbi:MAG: PspC domain-containing protein [Bacteroidetes bacterium]|jgi:phage shock protein PspC (stress-responsive transcriptional regulator)|nr:PspC domain-containing protein [Bacteroidota bacterium]